MNCQGEGRGFKSRFPLQSHFVCFSRYLPLLLLQEGATLRGYLVKVIVPTSLRTPDTFEIAVGLVEEAVCDG